MKRRRVLLGVLGVGLGWAAWRWWPDQGWRNPCLAGPLPAALRDHPLVKAAWAGLRPQQIWDCHVHLVGRGDSGSGAWIHSGQNTLAEPLRALQQRFYRNASCLSDTLGVDTGYVQRLLTLMDEMPPGVRLMLLAFDRYHDEQGRAMDARSAFYTPNAYAAAVAAAHPERFEWIASIHPYRPDAVEALEAAVAGGARAVKWLPQTMGIDPDAPRCDVFYAAMARLQVPLLTHAGAEWAVRSGGASEYGNPLRLRRPLEHGVRVIVAHCAGLGRGVDLDDRKRTRVSNLALFTRLMQMPRYRGRLFGDAAGVLQVNRCDRRLLKRLVSNSWRGRVVNGSDYPLPGVMPLYSMRQLVSFDLLTQSEAKVLSALRRYNPLLFDVALKRTVRIDGQRLPPVLFETRAVFSGH